MTAPARMTANELLEKYSDPELRSRIVRLYELKDFLGACVIRRNYKVPDRLNAALKVTDYGQALIIRASQRDRELSAKTIRLTCLLEFFHLDLLIDPLATDADEVADVISDEMAKGNIRLPFVFGPGLYMAAAELFEDERRFLSTTDTDRLLKEQPQGVFHHGPWLSGPFGIFRTAHIRGIGPSRRVPLQHCHDVGCRTVHATTLQSDQNAEINRRRAEINELLREDGDQPSEFGVFLGEVMRDLSALYDDEDQSALAFLIGDALSDRELRLLLIRLVQSGEVPDGLKSVLATSALEEFLEEKCGRAELLQLTLLFEDRRIVAVLDELVLGDDEGGIFVPAGERRRTVLTGARSSTFGNRPELSSLGFRLHSEGALGPLRLRRLIEQLFKPSSLEGTSDLDEVEELSWQLREVSGVTVAGRLDEYLRNASPDDVLRRLVLTTKTNVDVATRALGLSSAGVDDETLISRMLWKLGFQVALDESLHDRFWTLHEKMNQGARSANVSTIVDQEAMRGLGANYFVALENLLADTICFVSWAMTTDHVKAKHPFSYSGQVEAADGIAAVRERLRAAGSNADKRIEKWTLHPLVSSFGALADHLDELRKTSESFTRDDADRPEFAGQTTLQLFPLKHTIPFIDLTPESQLTILGVLRSVSQHLLDNAVHEVRNEQLHYTRASSSLDKLLKALAGVEKAVRALEDAGFTRVLFHADRYEGDRWGRSTYFFSDRKGREVAIGRPSQYAWLNMPSMRQAQYLLHAAQFAEPTEILRFTPRSESEFRTLWADFPQRRRRAVDWSEEEAPTQSTASSLTTGGRT